MAAIGESLRNDLREPEFSEGYAESFLDAWIATQIKVLREQEELTQAQLASRIGTKQTVISRYENVNYSSWSLTTLKKLARAFRVRLRVSFETYGSLLDEIEHFDRDRLARVPRERDPELLQQRELAPEGQAGQGQSSRTLPSIAHSAGALQETRKPMATASYGQYSRAHTESKNELSQRHSRAIDLVVRYGGGQSEWLGSIANGGSTQ